MNLMSDSINNLPGVQISTAQSEAQNRDASSSDSTQMPVAKSCKLPYRATHQVELLHLHAEVEVLLQQVRSLKQQRSVEVSVSEIEQPALAIR